MQVVSDLVYIYIIYVLRASSTKDFGVGMTHCKRGIYNTRCTSVYKSDAVSAWARVHHSILHFILNVRPCVCTVFNVNTHTHTQSCYGIFTRL